MSSTNTLTSTFTRYSNESMRSISMFYASVPAPSASPSTNWRNPQRPTFRSSSSLALSVHSCKGSPSRRNSNNNDSLPRRSPSNVRRTYFSGGLNADPYNAFVDWTVCSDVGCPLGSSAVHLVSSIGRRWIYSVSYRSNSGESAGSSVPDAGRGSSLRRAKVSS